MTCNVVRLGDVAKITSGFAFKSSYFNDSGEGLPLVRIRDVTTGSSETFYSGEFKEEFLIEDGDALIGMDGEFNLAKWRGGKALLNQRVCKVQAASRHVDQEYLIRFLPLALKRIEEMTPFVTVKHLSVKDLRDVEVPVPPISEQRRIAALLDKAETLSVMRRKAVAKIDQVCQAVFFDMFGDPAANPMGWRKLSLEQLVVVDAPLVDPREREYQDLFHFGPDRIAKDTGRLLAAKTAREDGLISKKFLCDSRHILYSKIRPYLNKVALVKERCLCSADVYPVEPKRELTRRFLWHILRSKDFLDHAASFSNRANIPKINREQFLQYECVVPPLEVQEKFDRLSTKLEALRVASENSAGRLDDLFSGLQQRAFSGEV